jgi:hypothetical protein
MNLQELQGRLAAIEILLITVVQHLDKSDFAADYKSQKENALTAHLNNPTVSDEMHASIEESLKRLEEHFLIDLKYIDENGAENLG